MDDFAIPGQPPTYGLFGFTGTAEFTVTRVPEPPVLMTLLGGLALLFVGAAIFRRGHKAASNPISE